MNGFRSIKTVAELERVTGRRVSANTILARAGVKVPRVMTHKRAKARAWKACADYVKLRDALKTTGNSSLCRCVTCGALKTVGGVYGIQAGHFLGGRAGKNLFDVRGVHGQCQRCNKYLHGNNQAYGEFMRRTYGETVMEELERQANTNYSWSVEELLAVERNYKRLKETLVEGI